MGYLLGVDVGTTNTKAVLYDPSVGRVVAVASRPTTTYHPRPIWSEFDPAEIWRSAAECIREAVAGRERDVRAVSVASMAEAGVPIDAEGRFLYSVIAWHDPRTQPQAARWHEWLGDRRAFEITGQSIQAKFSLNKLLWLRDEEPEAYVRTTKWLCMEDLVLWKLSGAFATDYTLASRTFAFDQRRRDWSEEVLGRADVAVSLFPKAYPSGTKVGEVDARGSAETGLPAGTPVVTGGHDHLCGSLAAGIVGPGTILASMGTAMGCVALSKSFDPSEALLAGGYCTYAHVIDGLYVVLFGISTSGGFLEWLVRQLSPEAAESPEKSGRAFEELLAAAAQVAPGSDGLFWMPHLRGATSPHADEFSKACLVGLTQAHGRGHVVRAALEGISYLLRDNLGTVAQETKLPADAEIVAIGGGTRSPLWMQVKADVTGRRVRVVEVPEATALGAALLAGVGAGVFGSAAEAAASVDRPSTVYEPDASRVRAYDRYYQQVYRELYPALRTINHRIHEEFWAESKEEA